MNSVGALSANEIILLAHHPDLAHRPAARPGLVTAEDGCTALTWNVFRTLELIAPAFWLRRFRARLVGLSSLDPVSRSLDVRLCAILPTPTDRMRQDPIPVDVLVETETAVYGVMAFDGADLDTGDSTLARPDAVLRMIDAVSWYAGVRDCYIALVTSDRSDTPIGTALVDRYAGSRDVLLRRLPHRRDGLVNLCGIGSMTWRDVSSIIRDCADAGDSLTELERYAARRTAQWLDSIGIHPVD